MAAAANRRRQTAKKPDEIMVAAAVVIEPVSFSKNTGKTVRIERGDSQNTVTKCSIHAGFQPNLFEK
jgi:hypothetical protein